MPKNLIWLASYPKSGNTWTRLFLGACEAIKAGKEVNLDVLKTDETSHASARIYFQAELGIDVSLQTDREIRLQQSKVYRQLNKKLGIRKLILKNHDAYDRRVFLPSLTDRAVYLVRNPLEVACSYANHNQSSIDRAIVNMEDSKHAIGGVQNHKVFPGQVLQPMKSWSYHVESWTKCKDFPVLVIRYEDLNADPKKHFSELVDFLDLSYDSSLIDRAIDATQFKKIQILEEKSSFNEKPLGTESFFRQGKVDGWKKELNMNQVKKIKDKHEIVMNELGYL